MAKKKKHGKRKGKVPPHLRKFLFKKGHNAPKKKRRASSKKSKKKHHHHTKASHHMAKKKRRSSKKRRHHTGRRSHGGGGGGILGGVMRDAPLIAAGAAVGFIEKSIKSQDQLGKALASLPAPIDALGRVGNLSVLAYVGSYLFKGTIGHYLGVGAKVGAIITARDMVKAGKAFASGTDISGPGDGSYETAAEHILGEDEIGELAEEVAGILKGRADFELDTGDDHGGLHTDAEQQHEEIHDAAPPG